MSSKLLFWSSCMFFFSIVWYHVCCCYRCPLLLIDWKKESCGITLVVEVASEGDEHCHGNGCVGDVGSGRNGMMLKVGIKHLLEDKLPKCSGINGRMMATYIYSIHRGKFSNYFFFHKN